MNRLITQTHNRKKISKNFKPGRIANSFTNDFYKVKTL